MHLGMQAQKLNAHLTLNPMLVFIVDIRNKNICNFISPDYQKVLFYYFLTQLNFTQVKKCAISGQFKY